MAVIAVLVSAALATNTNSPASAEDSDEILARELIDRFYDDLAPDKAALAALLGDGFQIIGSDGKHFDKKQYLEFPVTVADYAISDLVARRDGDILTATFSVSYHGNVEGAERAVPHLARLAVFQRRGDGWKLQAFAALGTGANDVTAEAAKALTRFFDAYLTGDPADVGDLLAPDFQIQRSSGAGYALKDYLASDLPVIERTPTISDLVATSFNNAMVTRYMLHVEETIDGEPVKALAPRLTVFQRINGRWLVSAHANFAARPK